MDASALEISAKNVCHKTWRGASSFKFELVENVETFNLKMCWLHSTSSINFINFRRTSFLYEKCTRKTLMKLTTVRRNLKVSFMTGIEIKLIYDILFVSFTMFCNVSLLFDGLCWCKNTAIKLLRNIIVVCYMSISSTFSERILRWYFGAKKFQTQNTAL